MKNKNEHIIFDNYGVDIDDWRELFDDIEEQNGVELSDGEKWEIFNDELAEWIDAERENLNRRVDGDIIAIADLGLWDGRRTGYKIVGDNIRDILYSDCDYVTWTCDRYNVRGRLIHHDGTNYILYRVLRAGLTDEQRERFLDALYYGTVNDRMIRRYTRSLAPDVAEVYGWTVYRAEQKQRRGREPAQEQRTEQEVKIAA